MRGPCRPARPTAVTVALAMVLTAASPLFAQELRIANPDLFGKSMDAARQALDHYGAFDDAAARQRIATIGYQLAVESGYRESPFSFYLIDMPVPNAFALPGGQIFVTRGMLDLGLSDDMLANLLGHEIAHVFRRHGTRMQKRAMLLNLLSQALLVGVLVGVDDQRSVGADGRYLPGDSRKGSMVQGAMATGIMVSELLLRDHSRDFEDEADDEGQRLAAAAGFDPAGAQQLWELMRQRLPKSNEYGYWRTHPFSADRERSAGARAAELKVQQPAPAEDYRAATQQVLLAFRDDTREKSKGKEEKVEKRVRFAELSALLAWPKGSRAEELRLTALHRLRDSKTTAERVLDRDYGAVVRAFVAAIDEVRAVDSETSFPAQLEREMADLRAESIEIYPEAVKVWDEGFWQTQFLEIFLSNYPTVKEAPPVALALGNAYARLGRQTDAVTEYLRATEAGSEDPSAGRALEGLANLTPRLDELPALQRIADRVSDAEIQRLAAARLDQLAGTYERLIDGAAYLEQYPDGDHAEAVRERLEVLARDLYGEVVMYQGIGDSLQALERINLILTHAPLTRAAAQLREQAVLES